MRNFGRQCPTYALIRVLVTGEEEVFSEEPGLGVFPRGLGVEADAGAQAALLRVPEIAAFAHAGTDIGEGADGGVVKVHIRRPALRKQELGSEGSLATLNEYTMD